MPENAGARVSAGRFAPPGLRGALAAVGAALVPVVLLFGFTVDDALITARVAHQLALGNGYRFNPGGPLVDAVTPLGFAYLLAPFAAPGPLAALGFAKWLGVAAWLAAAAWLGNALERCGRIALVTGLSLLMAVTPLAAWSASGMETGVVTLLSTLALGRSRWSPLAAGVAAGLRPELGAWALAVTLGPAWLEREKSERPGLFVLRALGLGLGPLVLVAALRTAVFGQAYPLSVLAKPSDPTHGAFYALGALLHTGPAFLLVARLSSYRALSRASRTALFGALVHFGALVLVGGDWMPLYRLAVPVLPGLILAGCELNQASASSFGRVARSFVALGVCLNLAARLGPSAARVGEQRARLITESRDALAGARRIATLDVGWVGAATPAEVVDLAGVTDPRVARLPGGHTTKRLPEGFLDARGVDALVVLSERPRTLPLSELAFVRGVEARLPSLEGASEFEPVRAVPLLGTTQGYVIYRRRSPRPSG